MSSSQNAHVGNGSGGIEPHLIVLDGACPNESYPIYEGVNWVGVYSNDRSVDIDLSVQEPPGEYRISAEHARITLEKGQLFIEDLYSETGTSVNGRLIGQGIRHPLPLNAKIQIGSVLLQVRI